MMHDPNDSITIFSASTHNSDLTIKDLQIYDDAILKSWNWIPETDPKNLTGRDCLPGLIVMLNFLKVKKVGSFVVSQPKSFFETGEKSSKLGDQITTNIAVHLSMLSMDSGDRVSSELITHFAESDFEFSITECYITLAVEDGRLKPLVAPCSYREFD